MLRLFLLLIFTVTSAAAHAAPRILFHTGDREVLAQDIAAHTIPQPAWDRFVFGKTNFDLPEFRKGLYGAERLSDINLYLAYELLAGRKPWVMSVQVGPECRTDSAVFTSEYIVFPESNPRSKQNRFSSWYWANHINQLKGSEQCLLTGSDRLYWDDQALYDLHSLSQSEQTRLAVCNDVMNRFIQSQQIRTLVDPVNDDSWYLRDRSCIQNIRGTVADNFVRLLNNGFGDRRDPVSTNWYGNLGDPGSTYSGHTIFVLSVLSEIEAKLGDREVAKIKAVTDNLDRVYGVSQDPLSLNLDHNSDNPQIVSLALKSMTRAIHEARLAAWQASLRPLLKGLVLELGQACHGHHGVPAAFQDACQKTSSAGSARLAILLLS